MDRRIFFKYLSYGSSGALLAPTLLGSCTLNGDSHSDHALSFNGIMPIAGAIDCSRLLLASGVLREPYMQLIHGSIHQSLPGNLSRLGSSIPFDDQVILECFEKLRKDWDPEDTQQIKKASLLFGWLMFRPMRKSMSEVYRKLVNQGYHYDTITYYYDAFILNQISGADNADLDLNSLKELLHTLPARMITRVHTLKPDYLDGPGWVNEMSSWRVQNREHMDQYAEWMAGKDDEMHDRLIKRYNVYQKEDILIQFVRTLRGTADKEYVEKLFLSDPGNSIYTRSLISGYQNVLNAQEYLDGNSGIGPLNQQL